MTTNYKAFFQKTRNEYYVIISYMHEKDKFQSLVAVFPDEDNAKNLSQWINEKYIKRALLRKYLDSEYIFKHSGSDISIGHTDRWKINIKNYTKLQIQLTRDIKQKYSVKK